MAKRRWWVIGLGVVGGVTGLALLGLVGFGAFLSTRTGEEWLSGTVEDALTGENTRGSVGSIETDLWTGATVEDFELVGDGLVVKVGRLDADIDRNALLRGELRFKRARADGVLVELTAAEEVSDEPFAGLPIDLGIDAVDLHGAQVVYRAADGTEITRVVGGSGSARFEAVDDRIRVEDLDVKALVGLTGATTAHVRGAIEVNPEGTFLEDLDVRLPTATLKVGGSIQEELDLGIDAERLVLSEVDPLIGQPGLDGVLRGTVRVTGPSDRIHWEADLRGIEDTVGSARLEGGVDLTGERLGWTVSGGVDQLDASQLYPGLGEDPFVLTGELELDGRGTSWPDDLELSVDWAGTEHRVFGQTIREARAKVHLVDGVVTLEQTSLEGLVGKLAITGTVDADGGPMSLVAEGSLNPADLRDLGVSGVDSPGWIRATITGDVMDPDAPIRVDGTARFAPFRSGESIRFEEVLASYSVRIQGEDIRGTASVDATEGEASGVALDAAHVEGLSFRQSPAGLRVEGPVIAEGVAMPDLFSTPRAEGRWTVTDDVITATVDLASPTLLGREGTGGKVSIDLHGDDLAFDVRMDGARAPLLATRGGMNLQRSTVVLDHLELNPTEEVRWVADRQVSLRLTEGGVADAEILLSSGKSQLEIRGQLGTTGPLAGSLETRRLDLARLAALAPEQLDGLGGTLDLALTVGGSGRAATLEGTVDARGLAWSDQLAALDLDGTLGAADGHLDLALDLAANGDPLARIEGRLPARLDLSSPGLDPDGRADLTLALRPGSFARIGTVSPSQASSLPVGRGSLVLEVDGRLAEPDLHLAGVVETAVEGWDDPARVEFELNRADGATTGWADLRRGYKNLAQSFTMAQLELAPALRPMLVDGGLPEDFSSETVVRDLYLTGVLLEIPVGLLTSAAGLDDLLLRGRLSGGFQVQGTPEDPVLDASINWIDGRIGRQHLDGLDLSMTHVEEGYQVALDMRFPDDSAFQLGGTVPLEVDLSQPADSWSTGPMKLTFGGDGIPLRVLTAVDPSLVGARGVLQLTGTIGGSPFDPAPDFAAKLEGGAVTLNDFGIRVEELALEASGTREAIEGTFSGNTRPTRGRFDLQDVTSSAVSAVDEAVRDLDPEATEDLPDSHFRGGGKVTLVDGSLGEVQGRVRLINGAWVVRTNDLQMRLDGRLRASGTWPDLEVNGNLGLRQGLVKLDAAAFVDRAPLEPDPRISFVRGDDTLRVDDEEAPPWYKDVHASVDLDLRRAMELEVSMPFVDDLGSLGALVSTADLFTRIGGQAQLTLDDGEPSMVGGLDLNEGRLKILGRRFDVEDGGITFTGADIAEPRLDITAKADVANVPVTATVGGTPSSPGIELGCDGYPSESDCLMIVVTGNTPDGQGGDTNALAALSGLALGGVLGEQNVADVSIEPDGTLQVGASVFNGVYVTYSYRANSEIGENQNVVEADVGLSRRVTLNVAGGDTRSWLDLFWEIRF